MGFSDHFKELIQPVLLAGAIALAAMSVVYFIGTRLVDASMDIVVNDRDMNVTWLNCVILTILAVVTAGLVAALLATYTDSPDKIFLIVAVVVFIVMSLGPLTGDADRDTKVTLMAIHFAVALPILGVLLPVLREPDTPLTAEDIRRQMRDSA